ncbi:MAG: alpha/beta fold hydrolase [Myxococcota bacterium]|nr:alpha/beta fold hydrolase [Myxococcota bacterium]
MPRHALLFVHGAFHGPWCWDEIVTRVQSPEVACRCVELYRGGLEQDAAAVREEIDALAAEGMRVAVVAHSLGCASLGHLGPERIGHAVFLAGSVAGKELPNTRGAINPRFIESVTIDTDNVMEIDEAVAREFFYHDCDPKLAEWAAGKLRPNLAYSPALRPGPSLHDTVPSTYLWCEHDRAVLPNYQRQVAGHTRYSEGFPTSHSPMLSAPDTLARALGRVLERTQEREEA